MDLGMLKQVQHDRPERPSHARGSFGFIMEARHLGRRYQSIVIPSPSTPLKGKLESRDLIGMRLAFARDPSGFALGMTLRVRFLDSRTHSK